MIEPVWISVELVQAIHERQLAIFGGGSGLRDLGALQSAVDRARNKFIYENAGLPTLTAAYAFGIAKNHPFVDGNNRVALLSLVTFLGLNRVEFIAPEAEAVVMIRGLAASEVSEDDLKHWIAANIRDLVS